MTLTLGVDETLSPTVKKILALDAMGVVYINEDDVEELLIPYLKKKFDHLDVEKLRDLYYNQVSLGKISSKEFFNKLNIPDVEREYLDECLTIDPLFSSVAPNLCKRFVLAMFSNDVSEWSFYLRREYGLDRYFSRYIISGDMGLRKPDPRIYRVLLEELGIHGDQCVLVDNSLINLEPASKLGIKTIHFERSKSEYTYKPDYVVSDFFELERLLYRI